MSRIKHFLLKFLLASFGAIPFRVIYVLSDGLAFLLYRVVRYRSRVVEGNLRRAFPEKSDDEIRQIIRQFYSSLADVSLESLQSSTISPAEATRRCRPVNPELVNFYLDQNRSVILAGSHLGNWEWGGLSMPPTFHGATITAFKPVSDKTVENFFNDARSRTGMELVSMEDLFRVMRKRSTEAAVFILLGDQSPSSRKSAHWVNFFGQPTATLPGTDVLARKFSFPVIYYRTVRRSRGLYEIEFEEICADPSVMSEKAITQKYADLLENDIRKQPEQWLWSHKRWKMEREL